MVVYLEVFSEVGVCVFVEKLGKREKDWIFIIGSVLIKIGVVYR